MNDPFFGLPQIQDRRYLARVNPANGMVFGAFVVLPFTYTGVMRAALDSRANLKENRGVYMSIASICYDTYYQTDLTTVQ